jgi:hypothetical protein
LNLSADFSLGKYDSDWFTYSCIDLARSTKKKNNHTFNDMIGKGKRKPDTESIAQRVKKKHAEIPLLTQITIPFDTKERDQEENDWQLQVRNKIHELLSLNGFCILDHHALLQNDELKKLPLRTGIVATRGKHTLGFCFKGRLWKSDSVDFLSAVQSIADVHYYFIVRDASSMTKHYIQNVRNVQVVGYKTMATSWVKSFHASVHRHVSQKEQEERKIDIHTLDTISWKDRVCLSSLALPGDVIEFVETASSFSHGSITIRIMKRVVE